MHDWFNAKSASLLVAASQARVSRQALTMDNEPDEDTQPPERADANGAQDGVDRFADDELALHDAEVSQKAADTGEPINVDDDDMAVMETFATQTQTVRQERLDGDGEAGMAEIEDDDVALREITSDAPPVFRPLAFPIEEDLLSSVQRRLKKGYEAFLEEQPKWSLLGKVLKEIEDTIARVTESHAGMLTDFVMFPTEMFPMDGLQMPLEPTSFSLWRRPIARVFNSASTLPQWRKQSHHSALAPDGR